VKSLHFLTFQTNSVAALGTTLLVLATSHPTLPGVAAVAPKHPSTLSFEMTARFASKDTLVDPASTEQTVTGKVYVDGKRVRAESQWGDRPVIYLYAPPYGYKLLPISKSGLRYHVTPAAVPGASSNFDPQTLLPLLQNPGALRAALNKQGAQRMGSTQLNGTPVDIYVSNNYKGKPLKIKAWLRRSDALPARLEMVSKKLSVTASWRNYQHGRVLANSLFAVPASYHIRDAQGQFNNM